MATTKCNETAPLLRWAEEWYPTAGRGIVLGLLDTDFDEQIPDLVGADLVVRNFTGSAQGNTELRGHGTHSVAMLVGQGHYQIRGIAPQTHLLLAKVVESDNVATPQAVVEAIDWLVNSSAQIIVLPLGESIERKEIAQQIERSSQCGVLYFAAAGNGYPEPLVFPARHPFVIAVGAADVHGHLLPECSRLPRLDLVAPGWNIAAPIRGRVIRRRRGSSVACVIAAATAVLALSAGVISPTAVCRASILTVLRRTPVARSPPD